MVPLLLVLASVSPARCSDKLSDLCGVSSWETSLPRSQHQVSAFSFSQHEIPREINSTSMGTIASTVSQSKSMTKISL